MCHETSGLNHFSWLEVRIINKSWSLFLNETGWCPGDFPGRHTECLPALRNQRETSIGCLPHAPWALWPGTELKTWICALTGSNLPPIGTWDDASTNWATRARAPVFYHWRLFILERLMKSYFYYSSILSRVFRPWHLKSISKTSMPG